MRLNIAREVLDRAIEQGRGSRIALLSESGALTYAELKARVDALAWGLKSLGVNRGDPVLILVPNSPEFAAAFLALVKLGALPALANSLLGIEELEAILRQAEPKVAVTESSRAETLRALARPYRLERVVCVGEPRADEIAFASLAAAKKETFPAAETGADEPAFIVFTSGTTGKPKGIVHAHRWLTALGDLNRLRLPPEDGDVVMATGEWSFVSALGHNVLFALRNGVCGAILPRRATPEKILAAVERYRVTVLYSVATVYRRMLAVKDLEKRYDLSSLRCANATGEALREATYHEWKKRVGCEIYEHYGVSEFQLVVGQGPKNPVKPGSVGKPLPGLRVAILDAESRPIPPGEIGYFAIAKTEPGLFLGYYRDPERTSAAFQSGWYRTGDLAYQDEDGYVFIAGRADDCFKSRGIFIAPAEIENALQKIPGVAEAAVIPEPDSDIGNRIRAIVVLAEGYEPTAERAQAIRDALRRMVAPYKVPHGIEFAPSLPKSPVGKILRAQLSRRNDLW